jgi:hypothetical protein
MWLAIQTTAFGCFFGLLIMWLVWSIVAAFTPYKPKPKPVVPCPFVVGKMYYITHEDEGPIEAVYMGLDLEGFRHFQNLKTGNGMKYKRSNPNQLIVDRDVIPMTYQPQVRR